MVTPQQITAHHGCFQKIFDLGITSHHLGIREELKKNWPKMASGLVGHCVDVVQDWQQPLLGNLPVKEGQVGGETLREEGIKGKI